MEKTAEIKRVRNVKRMMGIRIRNIKEDIAPVTKKY